MNICLKFKKIIDDIKKISNFNVFINIMIDRPKKYIDNLKDYIENNIIKIYDYDYDEQERLIKDSDIILLPINSKDFNISGFPWDAKLKIILLLIIMNLRVRASSLLQNYRFE